MKIDFNELRARSKYICEQKHPHYDLIIWNYTHSCQYDNAWDDYTKMCRGLITDLEGNIVARPFPKFFNLNQLEETKIENLPAELPAIFEKLDGSLGILYFTEGVPAMATRGSFVSDQALWATDWIRRHCEQYGYPEGHFLPGYTYLFEIIYPQNKIVVDYAGRAECVLLAVINNETGKDIGHISIAQSLNLPYAKQVNKTLKQLEEYVATMSGNEEGFVLRYADGFRVKIKGPEYVRLHKLITNFSSKSIWECLMNGQDIAQYLDQVPDEFYQWVKNKERDLREQHRALELVMIEAYNTAKELPTRKEQAIWITANAPKISGAVFNMLDKQEDRANLALWKMLRPTFEKPFRVDIDA